MKTRRITNDDIWSASRGLRMWSRPLAELDKLAETHDGIDAFASRVIVLAARQVKAARITIAAGR
jgi:hypothetical protein